MSETLITVDAVDKVYRVWSRPHARLTASFANRMARIPVLPPLLKQFAESHSSRVMKEFYALRGVNISIKKGETVGIIGKNGSGKSTVLKLIAGTLQPTRGRVQVVGRVAAMLELAAGFEPDFTGRENVFLSAAILGLKRTETDERLPGILEFADIGAFIDQPIKTYSSGMLVRLAFAVHTAIEPEILIIDEALSVGDETFRRKCFARLDELRDKGTTILFVSHDLNSVVNLTQRALFLHEGELVMEGKPQDVVQQYQRYCHSNKEDATAFVRALKSGKTTRAIGIENTKKEADPKEEQYDPYLVSKSRLEYPPRGGRIQNLELLDTGGNKANLLRRGNKYAFSYRVAFDEKAEDVTFAMLIKTMKGQELGGSRTLPWDQFIPVVEAGQEYRIRFVFSALLTPGVYFLNAGVEGKVDGKRAYVHRIMDAVAFRVVSEKDHFPTGIVDFRIEPAMEQIQPE
jgi:lipopolysaccharide transport system ATP-binding protein